ncbi:MAG: hypothetical protein MJZ36_00140 [Bacteroidaceae bacterium]|nr:hypothetical protein [Bacteroidaceae bacterium]
MKKLVKTFLAFIASAAIFTSCLPEGKNSATITFVAVLDSDSIFYSDPADSIFSTDIIKALTKEKKLGYDSRFQTSAESQISTQDAIYDCYKQAETHFKQHFTPVNLKYVKECIYKLNPDSLNKLGYTSSESIPLDEFKMRAQALDLMYGNYIIIPLDVK